ncbi:phage tail tube protein [Rhizobium mayense]|uniref:Phage tail tube protein n=1 Tax=Rhizobium mayense TaxID=1312184 RepID=A0ABT7JY25_9HYPH|nr:phage tail tube protein [Rhizobium mayense]MDL2401251.1 phage tail tube protein [Rhizobium mayense]
MTQVLGIVDITWNGVNVPVEKGAEFRPGGIKNNSVTYGRKTARAQEYQGSLITATTNLEKGQSWSSLYGTNKEGELQVICDTGQTYVWEDAFLSGDIPNITGGDGGKIKLQWEGSTPTEILS